MKGTPFQRPPPLQSFDQSQTRSQKFGESRRSPLFIDHVTHLSALLHPAGRLLSQLPSISPHHKQRSHALLAPPIAHLPFPILKNQELLTDRRRSLPFRTLKARRDQDVHSSVQRPWIGGSEGWEDGKLYIYVWVAGLKGKSIVVGKV